jgi:hypothetical protein
LGVALVLLAAASGWLGYGNGPARAGFTPTPVAASAPARAFVVPLPGRVTAQTLVAHGVPAAGDTTLYTADSSGRITALAPNGYVRWTAELGQLARACPQLDGWGVTGTPAIDGAARVLYAADPFGRLHALDLATGRELDGWPVRLYRDYLRSHVFGALALRRGFVYVPTASYCDSPMEGKLIRVAAASRAVRSWTAVPFALGGGGGIWGFGGAAWSPGRGSFVVATGNAFAGGRNRGRRFSESAGFGEHLVELSPALSVRASSNPSDLTERLDLDFGSTPVVFQPTGCPELAAAANKNGVLYAWPTARIAAGPVWALPLRRPGVDPSLIGQPAYSAPLRSLYVVTPSRLVRVRIGRDCQASVAWSAALPVRNVQGSPTVAGGTVWFSVSGAQDGLRGVDARTGRARVRLPLHGDAFVAPTVFGGSLYAGSFAGTLHGFLAPGTRVGAAFSAFPPYSSRGWQSRENGVFDETGRRLYPRYALRVSRLSERAGLIQVGAPVGSCTCPRTLWTADAGATWRDAGRIGPLFAGRDATVWWTDGQTLFESAFPPRPRSSRAVARAGIGTIVALELAPDGVVALLATRARGLGWDNAPRLILRLDGRSTAVNLPAATGSVLVRTLEVAWPRLVVTGVNYTDAPDTGRERISWTSGDGGRTWAVSRSGAGG